MWEYKIIRLYDPEDSIELNILGEQGWELVAVTSGNDNYYFYAYLKRAIK